jgi:hypothetical protein
MGGKAWTLEEDAKLREIFERGENIAHSVAHFPGRTYDSMKARAIRTGVAHADYRSWTTEEDAILREIWETPCRIKDGMNRLPRRSYEAAKIRAERLGLSKKAPAERGTTGWLFRSIKTVLANGVCMSMKEIAEATGADRSSVRTVMQNHHGKAFRVAEWERIDANHSVMKWAIGTGPDAPKPAAKTSREYWKGYRDRKRIQRGFVNPFATAAGLVQAPNGQTGRVYKQSMDVEEWPQSRKAA